VQNAKVKSKEWHSGFTESHLWAADHQRKEIPEVVGVVVGNNIWPDAMMAQSLEQWQVVRKLTSKIADHKSQITNRPMTPWSNAPMVRSPFVDPTQPFQ
jgi:hypothetical protein